MIFKLPFGEPVTGNLVGPLWFPVAQGNQAYGVVEVWSGWGMCLH